MTSWHATLCTTISHHPFNINFFFQWTLSLSSWLQPSEQMKSIFSGILLFLSTDCSNHAIIILVGIMIFSSTQDKKLFFSLLNQKLLNMNFEFLSQHEYLSFLPEDSSLPLLILLTIPSLVLLWVFHTSLFITSLINLSFLFYYSVHKTGSPSSGSIEKETQETHHYQRIYQQVSKVWYPVVWQHIHWSSKSHLLTILPQKSYQPYPVWMSIWTLP